MARVSRRSKPGDRPVFVLARPSRPARELRAPELEPPLAVPNIAPFPFLAVGSRMLHKWWGLGLVVVLGVVWLVLGESGQPALRAEGGTADAVPVPPRPAAPVDVPQVGSAEVAASVGVEPAGASPSSSEPALVRKALEARAAGSASEADRLLRDAIQQAGSLEEAARAAYHLAASVGDQAERRQLLSLALESGVVRGAEYEQVGAWLRELNAQPAQSLQPLLQLQDYTVVSGDSLWKVCNRKLPGVVGTAPEVGLVRLVNGLKQDGLRVGQVLRIPREPLTIRVDTAQHGLVAWLGDVAVAAYRVGLGKDESTPRRSFTVEVKQENPAWFYAGRTIPFGDPENILGTRWMGFDNQPEASGFGIHGTSRPESIGRNESSGCVRMRNPDVEDLFELVARGTQVTIQ